MNESVLRDCYEAFVLYQFQSLFLLYFMLEAPSYFKDTETSAKNKSIYIGDDDDDEGDENASIQSILDNENEDNVTRTTSFYFPLLKRSNHQVVFYPISWNKYPGISPF